MEELADVLGDDDSALDTSAVAAKRRTRLSMDDEDSPPSTSEDISQGLVKRGPGRPKSAGKKKTPSPSQKKGKEVVNGSSRTSRSSKSPLESHDVSPADTSRANRSARKEKKEETKEDESKKASSAKMSAQKVKTKGVNLNGDEEGMDKTLIGVNIRKNFPGMGVFAGTVISYDNPYYRVKYLADDDEEEMEPSEIANYRIDKEVEGQFTQAIGGSARDEEPEEMQYDDDKRGDTRGDKDDSEPVEPMLQRRSSRSSSSSASVLSSSATKGYSVRRSSRGQSTSAKKRKSWVEQDTVEEEEEEEEEELVVPMKTSTSASSAAQKEKNGRRRSLSSSRSRSDDSDESHIESPEAVSAPVPAARAASSSERPSTGDKRSSIKKTPRTKSGDNDEGDVSGRERGGLDVALSLDKRRQSLGRLPASEREALDAESLEIAHGLIATNLQSPKPPSSQQSVQDNRSRSTRKAVRDHIYSIPKGRMPHESIWVHMTNAEKAPFLEERGRFVQEKRRLAIEGDRQKSLALSEEDTYQNIKEQICRASEIQALLKEASNIEDKSERKVANRKVRAIIADKATSLLDQGYTATKGALFGPSGSTSASSSSYKAAAASSSSSGSSSSVKSASAAKRARMWDQEDQEEEESVNTQPGGDVYYPDSTALQDPIGDNYSNLSGSDGDEKEKENKGSRRLSGSSSWNQSQSQRGTDTKKRVAESQESYRSAISLGSSGKKRRGSGIGSAQRNVQQPRVFSSSRGGSPFSQSRPFSRAGSSSTKKRGAEALEPAAAPAPAVSAAEEHRLKMLEISQRNLAKKSRRVRL
jgi:hypothetical protein